MLAIKWVSVNYTRTHQSMDEHNHDFSSLSIYMHIHSGVNKGNHIDTLCIDMDVDEPLTHALVHV